MLLINKTTFSRALAVVTAALLLGSCVVNPVTGKRELTLVSEQQELNIGAQAYAPLSQAEGGEYKVDPKLSAYVKEIGARVAAVSDRNLPYEFVLLNNPVPNAWALPGGKIAVNLGLLWELDNEAELAAVLGHEVVHAAARHGARAQTRGILLQGAVLGAAIAMGGEKQAGTVLGAANIGAQYAMASRGRDAELESDFYGMQYMHKAGYDPRAAITLQEAFVRLSAGRKSDFFSELFSSHPPSQERVERNRKTAASFPAGGTLNKERYQQMTRYARTVRPAYEAYRLAQKAFAEKQPAEAEKHINRALKIEAKEARFHSFKGDIYASKKQWNSALKNYEQALRLDEQYFMTWLDRGIARAELKQNQTAAGDLKRSLELLPTAPGHYYLGLVSERQGNSQQAIQSYQAASQAKGEHGEKAKAALVRLDLPQNPSKYLKVGAGLSYQGELILTLQNPTNVAVRNVLVTVSDGQRSWKQPFRDTVAAGQQSQRQTGLGPWSPEQAKQLRIQVSSAEVVNQ